MSKPTSHIVEKIIIFVWVVALASCEDPQATTTQTTTTPTLDPRYRPLSWLIEPHPSPDAIVGMWHRGGFGDYPFSKSSLLFRRDGTGMAKDINQSPTGEITDFPPYPFKYKYLGGGTWEGPKGVFYHISGESLLRANNYCEDVLDRVE